MPKLDRESSQPSKYQGFGYFEFLIFFLAKAVELQCEAVEEMLKEAFLSGTDRIPMLNFVNR